MKRKVKGKVGEYALKVNISKAFDKVEREYLFALLLEMGFDTKLISWIRLCIETIDFNVMINEDIVGPILPRKGLRQWDPLSFYLFIIYMEGLIVLLKKVEGKWGIHDIKGAPILSHFLFVDNCFLFYRATDKDTEVL